MHRRNQFGGVWDRDLEHQKIHNYLVNAVKLVTIT